LIVGKGVSIGVSVDGANRHDMNMRTNRANICISNRTVYFNTVVLLAVFIMLTI